jgi:hypothetical protein
LQHEQRSSGELNVLRDLSLQPAVTFSFFIGLMRYFYHCILHVFVNTRIPSHEFSIEFYYFNKLTIFPLYFELFFTA